MLSNIIFRLQIRDKKTIISTIISVVITISISILGTGCGGGGVYEVSVPTPIPPSSPIVLSSPALSHNRIFIGSPEGFLYAFNSAGNSLWNFDTTASINSSPAVSIDGSIYFAQIMELFILQINRWIMLTYTTNGAVHSSSPAIDHLGRISGLVGSCDGNLYCSNPMETIIFTTNTVDGNTINLSVRIMFVETMQVGPLAISTSAALQFYKWNSGCYRWPRC